MYSCHLDYTTQQDNMMTGDCFNVIFYSHLAHYGCSVRLQKLMPLLYVSLLCVDSFVEVWPSVKVEGCLLIHAAVR